MLIADILIRNREAFEERQRLSLYRFNRSAVWRSVQQESSDHIRVAGLVVEADRSLPPDSFFFGCWFLKLHRLFIWFLEVAAAVLLLVEDEVFEAVFREELFIGVQPRLEVSVWDEVAEEEIHDALTRAIAEIVLEMALDGREDFEAPLGFLFLDVLLVCF